MNTIRPTFQSKILIDLLSRTLFVVILVLFIYGGFAYWVSKKTFDDEMGARLLAIAGLTAGQVKADWMPYVSSQGELAQAFRDQLEKQRRQSGAENILILDLQGFVVTDAKGRYEFKKPYWPADLDPMPLHKVREGLAASSLLLTFQDGQVYKVGYAPLMGKGNHPVGILAVEASAKFIEGLRQFARVLFFFGLVCLGISGGVIFVFGQRFVRPIKEMARAAQKIATGDFSTRVRAASPNELGALAHAFNEMTGRLEAHNEYILESMSNGLIVIDLKNNVVSFNKAAGKILGLEPGDVVGHHFEQAFEEHPEFLQVIWPSLTQGKIMTGAEVRLTGENPKVLNFQSAPLLGEDEQILGTEIIITDETQVKKLESEVKAAEKMATIGQLAAGIAHEIRNPLGAMRGFTEILTRRLEARPDTPSEIKEMVDDIGKEIDVLNKIVTNFLGFAKPTMLELQEIELFKAVESVKSLLQKEARPRGVRVKYKKARSLPVRLDPEPFRRAVFNVALNAVQASPKGGVVEIETRWLSDGELRDLFMREGAAEMPPNPSPAGWASVAIRDHGPGIPLPNLGRLFTPFFTTKTEGFGLGLSITQKIMETHGGGIGALPCADGGARFLLFLPMVSFMKE